MIGSQDNEFAIILINSRPSWLVGSMHLWLDTILVISSEPTHSISVENLLIMLSLLEDEDIEGQDIPGIPHSESAQHVDNHLDAVWAILLNPLTPTDLLESSVQSLVQYASKFFLMDQKLMHWDIQGCHKVVIPREKCYSLIS